MIKVSTRYGTLELPNDMEGHSVSTWRETLRYSQRQTFDKLAMDLGVAAALGTVAKMPEFDTPIPGFNSVNPFLREDDEDDEDDDLVPVEFDDDEDDDLPDNVDFADEYFMEDEDLA